MVRFHPRSRKLENEKMEKWDNVTVFPFTHFHISAFSHFPLDSPGWWNWQTHRLEGAAPERACEFKSRSGHHNIELSSFAVRFV